MTQATLDTEPQERRQRTAAQTRLTEADQVISDIVTLMSEPFGRRIMAGLLAKTGVYRTSFAGDPAQTAFNEGRRDIGLQYLAIVQQYCADDFVLMLKEGKN